MAKRPPPSKPKAGKSSRPQLTEKDLEKVSGGKGKKGSDGGTTQPPK